MKAPYAARTGRLQGSPSTSRSPSQPSGLIAAHPHCGGLMTLRRPLQVHQGPLPVHTPRVPVQGAAAANTVLNPSQVRRNVPAASAPAVVTTTDLPLKVFRKGKVRDVYDLGDRLLMVATDRISAFDVVLEPGIPHKGSCLTQMSNFWFDRLKGEVRSEEHTS